MSAASTPSPIQGPVSDGDESRLPQGQCRYILLVPEIKGQRCACVNFTHNKALPSATCDCGHLACYHVQTVEPATDKIEVERLRQRVQDLEEQLHGDQPGSLRSFITRISQLEEMVEKSREEAMQMIQASARHVSIAMHDIEQLRTRQVAQLEKRVRELENGHMELLEADEVLEERLDALDSAEPYPPPRGRQRRKSTSDSFAPNTQMALLPRRRRSSASRPAIEEDPAIHLDRAFPAPTPLAVRGPSIAPASSSSWTAHISLLPSANLPFPFEKDTNAYKRCLSRGLHQVVVIGGPSSEAFVSAVEKAFGSNLRGRPWMPLQAKPCNAARLQGLPMLRNLDPELVDLPYDSNFLKQNCAVCDASGKIESLYIAMRSETLSWHFLRNAPVYKEGLEECWDFDDLLDPPAALDTDSMDEDDRPYAGDIVQSFSSLKRGASEISRSASFGSGQTIPEGEGTRPKMARTHVASLDDPPRRAQRV